MPTAAEFVKSNGLAAFGEVFIDPVVSATVFAESATRWSGIRDSRDQRATKPAYLFL